VIAAVVTFYVLIWVTLSYLIYRYGRYSAWRSTAAGKAYMFMKVAFWMLVCFGLATAAGLDGTGQAVARFTVLAVLQIALMVQVNVIVREQGGWRRRRTEQERDHPEFTGHRRRRILAGRAEKRRLAALAKTEQQ